MKTNKITSVLCAVAMLISALPAASAAEKEPLSQYAGQTITVQAVEETDDGLVSRLVEVAIPEGATETEARTLILATAFEWDMVSPQSDDFAVTSLGSRSNFTVDSSDVRIIRPTTLSRTLNEIYVTFNISSAPSPSYPITVRVDNITTGGSSSENTVNASISSDKLIHEVVFKTSSIRMNQGDQIAVYASSTRSFSISYCSVTGYYRY